MARNDEREPFEAAEQGPWGSVSRRSFCGGLASALIAGCKSDDGLHHEPGVAIVVPVLQATWIRNFNPFFPQQARWPAAAGVYEPLMIYNNVTSEYVPWLATEYRWSDGNTKLTLELRKGVKWSDGKPFTPRDALFTFRLMQKHRALDYYGVWDKIVDVGATDSGMWVRFERPFVPGLYYVVLNPIVPEHVWKKVADPVKFADPNPVGTGPFTEIRSFKTQVYELGRNPNYWQPGKPKLEAVRVPAFAGNEQASLALIKGSIDWTGLFIPSVERIFVAKNPEHYNYFYPKVEGTVMLYANTTRKPFDDVRVRKALSMAIERERIVKIAMQGYTEPANATALSDLYKTWRDPRVIERHGDWTRYDPRAAGKLLDEVGFEAGADGWRVGPDGRPFSFELNCVTGWSDWTIAAQIMVRNFKALGIEAKLRTYEFNTWFQRLQTGDYDTSMSWSLGGPTPHSYYLRQMSTETVKPIGEAAQDNWQRFGLKKADELLARFAKTADHAEQMRLSSALQELFVEHAPAIPLFPGPSWGQSNSTRIKGFPSERNPYAMLAPFSTPYFLLVLVELEPR